MRYSVETRFKSPENDNLRQELNNFWNVEDVGSSDCVISKFEEDIFHDGTRYVTNLPFKSDHEELPDNFQVAKQRLTSQKNQLTRKRILKDYDDILQDYESNGIIERVPKNKICKETGQFHYLPHRAVVREDRETTKIRPCFDASYKVNGPSLNESLYSRPNLLSKIFDVLLRFRLNKIALLANIKQAFLNVGISAENADFLRLLWFDLESN